MVFEVLKLSKQVCLDGFRSMKVIETSLFGWIHKPKMIETTSFELHKTYNNHDFAILISEYKSKSSIFAHYSNSIENRFFAIMLRTTWLINYKQTNGYATFYPFYHLL